MTIVPLRLHRRPTPNLNHSPYQCPLCWAWPFTAHERWCDLATDQPRLAHPEEARVFRGLPVGVLAGTTGWVLFFAFLIWSLT